MKCTAILALVVTVVQASVVTQTNAPWGLARMSSSKKLAGDPQALTRSYIYDSSAGFGVDVYVLDTGVLATHTQFRGRVRWGPVFGGYPPNDGNGHGTHIAGTIGGSDFGVAKRVNIIAVKVLGDNGVGQDSNIVSGLNWVQNVARNSGRPSVVCMAFARPTSSAIDNTVMSLIGSGIHVIAAAGDDGADASNTSPARGGKAIRVSATDINDMRWNLANYGAPVSLFAPGVDIISSWIGSPTSTKSLSGTSSAAAHVAGLVALLISKQGNTTPESMKQKLQSLALAGVLSNVPAGTANLLVQSGTN